MVIIDKIMELIIKKLKQSHKEITIESCLKKFEEGIEKYFNDEEKKFYDKWFKEEGRDMIIAILSSRGIKPKKNSRSKKIIK